MEGESGKVFGYGPAKIVILILLLIILFCVHKRAPENFRGLSYSAGADQRFQQEPSATNQVPYETGYNMQILSRLPGISHKKIDPSTFQEHFRAQNKPPLKQEEVLASQLFSEHMSASPDDVVKNEISAAHEFSA